MKTGFKILFIMVFVLSALTSGLTVNAEILPVKDAWILSENCIVVLREDGDLLFANSIDAQNCELILHDVSDFNGNDTVLYKNGDVARVVITGDGNGKSIYKTEIVASNARAICSLPSFWYAYIDKNDVLRGKHAYVHKEETVIMENVKCCYDFDSHGMNYAISNDDKLYGFNVEKDTVNEIMTNVKDIKQANGDLLILRNNGDLYLCKDSETPNRIGTNIEDMSKVVYEDTWVDYYGIEFVNKNGEYFAGTATSGMKKYMDNVRDVYRYENDKSVITNDNKLYEFYHYAIDVNKSTTSITFNAEKIIGDTDYFVLKTDNKLYTNKTYKINRYVLDDVKDVIVYDKKLGVDKDVYLFIKNDGTLYGAFGEDTFVPKTPFITSFCQKPTNVIINNNNVELTAKIQTVNNRSMYPFRECLERMGATVLWDSVNEIAIGEYNGTAVEFPIGKKEYWVNGVKYEMDVASYIDNSIGRTYIPIRYAAEGLGFSVEWIEGASENTISIKK